MTRALKLLLSALLAAALLFAAAAGAMAWWLSGDGPRSQVEALATARLGVPVSLGRLSLDLWPLPSLTVAVSDVKIATQSPLSAEHIEVRPAWRKLLGTRMGLGTSEPRELEILSLTLRGVSVPQKGLDQLSQSLSKAEHPAQQIRGLGAQNALKTDAQAETAVVIVGLLAIPQSTQLDRVMWQSATGESLLISGDVNLSAERDHMQLRLELAGGVVSGPLRLSSQNGKTDWQLRGELAANNVELAQLPGIAQRMSGRLNGQMVLDAEAQRLAGVGAALQTRTAFNVDSAVIKGIDLAKAVRTLGLARDGGRGGETALQQLSGNLATHGTGAAMLITLTDLQAKSSLLRASGAVSVGAAVSPGAPRALSGKVDVDLTAGDGRLGQVMDQTVGQLVGIPLEISGTTAAPVVQPTRGAMIGGAIGSVIAPVIGTGAGAKMGDKAAKTLEAWKEKLFGK